MKIELGEKFNSVNLYDIIEANWNKSFNSKSVVFDFSKLEWISNSNRKFLNHLKLAANSWLVFDKAYTVYHQFSKWTDQKVWFVTRMRDNADFHVTKVLVDRIKRKKAYGVLK